jgi:DNA-binding NarL/FixJ family response regulator
MPHRTLLLEAVMSARIPVVISAVDPILEAGISVHLRAEPAIRLVSLPEADSDTIAIVVSHAVDARTLDSLRDLQRVGIGRTVLVASEVDDADVLSAAEAGVCGVVRTGEATPTRLLSAVRAASAGEGTVPSDLLGRLLGQVGRLQRHVLAPRGLTLTGLSQRESDILRLVADGMDTGEIARHLCYSERTVKTVLHDITSRFHLRNRSHAVAFALREGLI